MGEWKTHRFVKKDVALGFVKGVSNFASLTYPRVKKVGKHYIVRVKY
jgi:predicted alternative tryptophan synthase beta-subunit